jgi:hypothetical protein
MNGRRERIESGAPVVDLDFKGLEVHLRRR